MHDLQSTHDPLRESHVLLSRIKIFPLPVVGVAVPSPVILPLSKNNLHVHQPPEVILFEVYALDFVRTYDAVLVLAVCILRISVTFRGRFILSGVFFSYLSRRSYDFFTYSIPFLRT